MGHCFGGIKYTCPVTKKNTFSNSRLTVKLAEKFNLRFINLFLGRKNGLIQWRGTCDERKNKYKN